MGVTATAADNVAVAGVQFKLDGGNLGAEDTASPYGITWDTTTATNGSHTLTAVARDGAGNTTTSTGVTVTVSNTAPPPLRVLLGDQAIETKTDFNNEGLAEASQTTATASGTLSKVSVYIDATSTASKVLVGVYTDTLGHPGTLVSQGILNFPAAGAWNDVTMTSASITSGATYWIALLSPVGSGTIRFRDKTGLSGASKVEVSASTTLTALPATWASGPGYNDGPFSAFGSGS